MIGDLIFAGLAVVIGFAAALTFYAAGFMSGYDKGKKIQQKVMRHFLSKSQEAFANQGGHGHGRQGLN